MDLTAWLHFLKLAYSSLLQSQGRVQREMLQKTLTLNIDSQGLPVRRREKRDGNEFILIADVVESLKRMPEEIQWEPLT